MGIMSCGWRYKTKEKVQMGDNVLISKRWAKENNVKQEGVVCGLAGFVTVLASDNSKIDFDMRSLTLVSRGTTG